MPAATATPDQRELVRLLYLEHGHIKASQLSGFEYDTVRQWASRYGWTDKRDQALSQTVTRRVSDAVESELGQHEHTTRLTLAKYASNAAAAIHKSVHPTRYTKHANDIAKTMAIVHRQDDQKPGAQFSLNVLNLNMFSDDKPTTLDE